jgi:hypothetical protein
LNRCSAVPSPAWLGLGLDQIVGRPFEGGSDRQPRARLARQKHRAVESAIATRAQIRGEEHLAYHLAAVPARVFTGLVRPSSSFLTSASISAGGWRRSGFLEGSSGNASVW